MREHKVEQNTPEWFKLRAGKPTASMASSLVTSYGLPSDQLDGYAQFLASEVYMGKPRSDFSGNRHTERGHELEDLARMDYEMRVQLLTTRVGFCTDNLLQYGCSPDDFIGIDGATEYKCKSDKEHLKAIFNYDDTGKEPGEHYAQCQMMMFVTKKKYCDLFLYHPDYPSLTIRHEPDKSFHRVLKKQLKEVIIRRNYYVEKLNKLRRSA